MLMLKELSNHAPVSINSFTIVSNFLEIISFVKRNKWIIPEFSVGEFLLNYFCVRHCCTLRGNSHPTHKQLGCRRFHWKCSNWGWSDGSAFESASSSCRGPGFSAPTWGGSQLPVIPVTRDSSGNAFPWPLWAPAHTWPDTNSPRHTDT